MDKNDGAKIRILADIARGKAYKVTQNEKAKSVLAY